MQVVRKSKRPGFVVGKSKRTWLTVERFSEENPLFVPEQVSVLRSWLRQKTTNGIMIFDLIQGRVHDLGRRTKDDSSQRTALYCKRLFPREAGLASLNNLRRHSDSEDGRLLTVDLRRPPAKGSIATWHGLRQPCVPAWSSPALRPGPFLPSLASNVLFQPHFLASSCQPHLLIHSLRMFFSQ